jgi:hypothetical protein
MSKERYNQIIDETHDNYLKNCLNTKWMKENFFFDGSSNHHYYLRDEFINKCKTDQEFSERWGLKIEERELSLEERVNLLNDSGLIPTSKLMQSIVEPILSEHNIPSKQITFQYNGEKIEVYE